MLGSDYLSDLALLSLEDVRGRRDKARQTETDLSYMRRIVQGRLDIVRAEIARRDGSGDGGAVADGLAAILSADDAARPQPRGMGSFLGTEPSLADDQVAYLAGITSVDFTDVTTCGDDELSSARVSLEAAETSLSRTRREVHAVLDACAAELTRRYRDGLADVDALLAPPTAPRG